jgi:RNA polymerase sigma factor (sigma-70 family)
MDELTESTLIAQCRAGNAMAFEPLVRHHEGRALAVAGALLGDADDAADAVQDAFVKAYRSLSRLQDGSAFGPWFRTILRNLCMDRLRAPQHRRRATWSDAAADRVLSAEPEATRRLAAEDVSRTVHAALAGVSAEHRQILVLKELEGLSYADIAAATGIPAGTVASRLYHARASLKKQLEARGVTLEEAP